MTRKAWAVAVVLGILAFAAVGQNPSPDLILWNGKIFTSDSAHPYVQALAIRGARIVATGDSEKIKTLAGSKTKLIDVGGRTVIPGINDAHNHLTIFPAKTVHLRFKGMDPDWTEVKEAISKALAENRETSLLFGEFGPAVYFDPRVNRDALDGVAPAHAVFLQSITGHAAILNSAALSKLGIPENVRDPVAGRYERFPDGRLNGIEREYAVLAVGRKLSDLASKDTGAAQLRDFALEAARLGITSVQDMSDVMAPDRCAELLEKGEVPIRVRIMRMPMTTPECRDTKEGLSTPRHPAPLISVNGTKWLLDGTPMEGTLAKAQEWQEVLRTSAEEAWIRLATGFSEREMEAMLRESLENNDQLMVHVSGYASAKAMLEAMQGTGGSRVWATKRVRFEHGDGILSDLVPLVKALGVVVVQNPTHFDLGAILPGAHLGRVQPLRSLLEAGIPVAIGSDGPMNPYLNILLASVHPNRHEEAITREQAVVAYTLTAAYAQFAEKEKGSLEKGKLADLAVLSQDIFSVPGDELPKTESVLTLVGGKTVYDALEEPGRTR